MFYYKKDQEMSRKKVLNGKRVWELQGINSNEVKIMIVNVLQKVKKEFTDIMSVELDDEYDLI